MNTSQLKAYLADENKWLICYVPDGRIAVAREAIEAAGSTVETPGLLARAALKVTSTLKRDRRKGGFEIYTLEVFYEKPFPIYRLFHIYDGREQYVTYLDIMP